MIPISQPYLEALKLEYSSGVNFALSLNGVLGVPYYLYYYMYYFLHGQVREISAKIVPSSVPWAVKSTPCCEQVTFLGLLYGAHKLLEIRCSVPSDEPVLARECPNSKS